MKLIVAPEAAADIERLREFLADRDSRAAQRAAATLDQAIRSLQEFPDRGRPSGIPGIRELVVPFGRSGYLIRYVHVAASSAVVIVRIWHGREQRS